MLVKDFYLILGEDSIKFMSVEIDSETFRPINQLEDEIFDVFSASPTVINITDLAYVPINGSEWDGENFIHPEGEEFAPITQRPNIFARFSFLLDNKHALYYHALDSDWGKLMTAALSSDPMVVGKIEEV